MPHSSDHPQLILASASPRRQQLLQEAGVAFTVVHSNADETLQLGESPEAYALRVAQEKALTVAQRYPAGWILGADTIVEIDGQVLGKPKNIEDGFRMLRLLAGRRHQVKTAFVIIDDRGRIHTRQIVTSTVTFKPLSDSQIRDYLATGEPFDKAGAYAVQGRGSAFIEQLEGSYTNVVGLPVEEVMTVLHAVGVATRSKEPV